MGFGIRRGWGIILHVKVSRMHCVLIAASPSGCTRGRGRWTTRWLFSWRGRHARVPLVFLVLHPPVLKPNLYLALWKVQQVRDLLAPWTAEVVTEVEFLLQLEELRASKGCPRALWATGISPILSWTVLHCGIRRIFTLSFAWEKTSQP